MNIKGGLTQDAVPHSSKLDVKFPSSTPKQSVFKGQLDEVNPRAEPLESGKTNDKLNWLPWKRRKHGLPHSPQCSREKQRRVRNVLDVERLRDAMTREDCVEDNVTSLFHTVYRLMRQGIGEGQRRYYKLYNLKCRVLKAYENCMDKINAENLANVNSKLHEKEMRIETGYNDGKESDGNPDEGNE